MTNPAVASLCFPSYLRDCDGFYPVSNTAMQEVGPAAITLGLLHNIADTRTFSTYKAMGTLAEYSGIPRPTLKWQFAKLCSAGWIKNRGRQPRDGSKRKRRTPTYVLTQKALTNKKPYSAWPRWLARWPPGLSREQTLVYAVLLNRAYVVESIQQDPENHSGDCEERLYMPNAEIRRQTGLSRNTIHHAIEVLTNPRRPLLEEADEGGYNMILPDCAPEWLKGIHPAQMLSS